MNEDHSSTSPGHVLVLGAGFSHAVSEHLPLANELGRRASEIVPPGGATTSSSFSNEYPFETHLSLLAEAQPHLTEVENRGNEAEFARLLQAIVTTLDKNQATALADPSPRWFSELVSVLHYGCCTVITLNYDTLIEAAVASQDLHPYGSDMRPPPITALLVREEFPVPEALHQPRSVTTDDLLRGQPPQRPHGSWVGGPGAATMRLLKLHGSLDWWWVPRDESGVTLSRYDTGSTFGAPVPLTDENRSLHLPGLERFLIPPLATKSAYYRNPITRQLWQDAYRALCSAKRISLVGYSLPVTDIVMSGMLRSAIQSSDRQVTVDIVNLDTTGRRDLRDLRKRVMALSPPSSPQPNIIDGDDCVERFAGQLLSEASARVAHDLGSLQFTPGITGPPADVDWHQGSRRIARLETTDDGVLVVVTDDEPNWLSQPSGGHPSDLEVAEKAKAATRIVARHSDGQNLAVVSYAAADLSDPNLRHRLRLIPAG